MKRVGWDGTERVERMGDTRNPYEILVDKRKEKKNQSYILYIKKWSLSVDWIQLTQDKDQWRYLVSTVINTSSIKVVEHEGLFIYYLPKKKRVAWS